MWDPATEKWTTLAPMEVPRTYHSVALLLPDGRVFTGGGGLCGADCAENHMDAQVYSPPYLFGPNGAPASRPMITVSEGKPDWGAKIIVTADAALSSISMIRYGTSTHALNTDQRRIELCGPATNPCTGASAQAYTVTIPADKGIAIEGAWMLFGVDAAGVPSTSWKLRLGSATAYRFD
jgi:galactose oxidase